MHPEISRELINKIQVSLLSWFKEWGRSFPWRENKDAYAILLIEKLLQQTSVRLSLIEIYQKLLEKFPTTLDLAQANVSEIKQIIQPLGLLYRANDLILMAKDLIYKYSGEVPKDLKSLLSIYGVGDYSARAVLSFAYGQDIPVVDTNVARILYRAFGLTGKFPTNPARSRSLIELMGSLIPAGKSCEFNWAVIDLGSLVCIASNPLCGKCPLNFMCVFAQKQVVK